MPPATESRPSARYDLVMGQLMEAAEALFATRGFAGTSLGDLAAAVGLTRTGIYHYIRSKDDILAYLVRGFSLDTARELDRLAAATDEPVAARLRTAVRVMATKVATHPRRFRLLLNSEGALPEPLAKQYRQGRRRMVAALGRMLAEGAAAGVCRPVDAGLAAHALLGAVTWVSAWYPRDDGDGALPPEQMAERLTDIALGGVFASRMVEDGGIGALFGHLRDDLGRLQRMVEARGADE